VNQNRTIWTKAHQLIIVRFADGQRRAFNRQDLLVTRANARRLRVTAVSANSWGESATRLRSPLGQIWDSAVEKRANLQVALQILKLLNSLMVLGKALATHC
jgi:hypothetical protein